MTDDSDPTEKLVYVPPGAPTVPDRPRIELGLAQTDKVVSLGAFGIAPPDDGTPPTFRFFKVREFDCKSPAPYPTAWIPLRLTKLVGVLDAVREKWGSPLIVVSGYRTIHYNRMIGGALHSQHSEGRAADVRPSPEFDLPGRCRALHALVKRMWDAGELPDLGGLGVYPGWIHCDVRDRVPIGHLAEWTGSGIGSELTG